MLAEIQNTQETGYLVLDTPFHMSEDEGLLEGSEADLGRFEYGLGGLDAVLDVEVDEDLVLLPVRHSGLGEAVSHTPINDLREVIKSALQPGTPKAVNTIRALGDKSVRLARTAHDRAQAAYASRGEIKKLVAKIDKLEVRAKPLAKKIFMYDEEGSQFLNPGATKKEIQELNRILRRQGIMGRRAIRYQKVNALATGMAKNASMQTLLTQNIANAIAGGQFNSAAVLGALYGELGAATAQAKGIRKKQIVNSRLDHQQDMLEAQARRKTTLGVGSGLDSLEAGIDEFCRQVKRQKALEDVPEQLRAAGLGDLGISAAQARQVAKFKRLLLKKRAKARQVEKFKRLLQKRATAIAATKKKAAAANYPNILTKADAQRLGLLTSAQKKAAGYYYFRKKGWRRSLTPQLISKAEQKARTGMSGKQIKARVSAQYKAAKKVPVWFPPFKGYMPPQSKGRRGAGAEERITLTPIWEDIRNKPINRAWVVKYLKKHAPRVLPRLRWLEATPDHRDLDIRKRIRLLQKGKQWKKIALAKKNDDIKVLFTAGEIATAKKRAKVEGSRRIISEMLNSMGTPGERDYWDARVMHLWLHGRTRLGKTGYKGITYVDRIERAINERIAKAKLPNTRENRFKVIRDASIAFLKGLDKVLWDRRHPSNLKLMGRSFKEIGKGIGWGVGGLAKAVGKVVEGAATVIGKTVELGYKIAIPIPSLRKLTSKGLRAVGKVAAKIGNAVCDVATSSVGQIATAAIGSIAGGPQSGAAIMMAAKAGCGALKDSGLAEGKFNVSKLGDLAKKTNERMRKQYASPKAIAMTAAKYGASYIGASGLVDSATSAMSDTLTEAGGAIIQETGLSAAAAAANEMASKVGAIGTNEAMKQIKSVGGKFISREILDRGKREMMKLAPGVVRDIAKAARSPEALAFAAARKQATNQINKLIPPEVRRFAPLIANPRTALGRAVQQKIRKTLPSIPRVDKMLLGQAEKKINQTVARLPWQKRLNLNSRVASTRAALKGTPQKVQDIAAFRAKQQFVRALGIRI